MQEQLIELKNKVISELEGVKTLESLRDLELKFLGRKGELTQILRGIAGLSNEEKGKIGKLANEVKTELQGELAKLKEKFENIGSGKFVDVTLPGVMIKKGSLHPITQMQNELEDLFTDMGFMVLDGPEIEGDFFNFEGLNIPKHHPARDIQDTFYIDSESIGGEKGELDTVMRTHTSPVQVRAMLKYGAPLRAIVPGRVFRCEATDANHDTNFYQLEGMMIDEDLSVSNLISVLNEMLSAVFKQKTEIRVRPGYFPFVEPGLEIDMKCTICGGKGCPSCKHTGWLEMLGSGMIHPNVLKAGGIDPEKYSGFAFGMGIDRLVMMKHGIDDIRQFHAGDLRFMSQF